MAAIMVARRACRGEPLAGRGRGHRLCAVRRGRKAPVTDAETVARALEVHQEGCAHLGSPLYATLLTGLIADYAADGLTRRVLDGRSDRPVHDAVPLRLLGAVHRIVLEGRAPDLARFYPSAGGQETGDPTSTFLATVAEHLSEVEAGMAKGVQTNEVARAAVLAPGFALVARRAALPLRLREIGSSAGLLLRWDHYCYRADGVTLGDPASPLVFDRSWRDPKPDLGGPVAVLDRRGCDLAPIDASTSDGRLTLLSFVWPDQGGRFDRLRRALDVAAAHPVAVDRGDAAEWVEQQLAPLPPRSVTVVFHSIVLPYLSPSSRHRLRDALRYAGARATDYTPLAWLRMEPVRERGDLRLTWWPGGEEVVLATTGYHGQDIEWLAGP
jgi:hypothetical protein